MAITAIFNPTLGVLTVTGDTLINNIIISRNAAGTILVNGGAVPVTGGTSTIANTSSIQIFGQDGSDIITLNESLGALPAAGIFGGNGNETITGGSGGDEIFGETGDDILLGKGGNDTLRGGDNNDTLTGGDADDQMFGEAGDDRLIWNPGDDTDLHEGGDGIDTTEVNGGNGAEQFAITANGARVRFDRIDPAPFSIDMGTMERLVLNANGGDDQISATGNLAALISITIDGGAGNDTILASNGADVLLGGDGNDIVDGQQGNDVAFLGAGNDTFQWDPGDGSDIVEGQDGIDTLLFNGSAGSEIIAMSANGSRALFTRNIGNIIMDLNDVEAIRFQAFGGADNITVGDLSATDVDIVMIDLAVAGVGDGFADAVRVDGTSAGDVIEVSAPGGVGQVLGLPVAVQVQGIESIDQMIARGGGGNDSINASTILAGAFGLTLDGGTGNDNLIGSGGTDLFLGDIGNDAVDGQQGNDIAFLGAGNDVFQWDPGDGSDVVEGEGDLDTLRFNGANASEIMDVFANGGRAVVFRDVGSITMDLDDIERIELNALGGADDIAVGDMSGTDVTRVTINLAGPGGGGDGAADRVDVSGTQGDDLINVTSAGTVITVSGLQASTRVENIEAGDVVSINAAGGNDVIDASKSAIGITVNSGLGNDVIIGSNGVDVVLGGDGDDVALLGLGNDTFVWNPGDDNDTIEGQGGTDTLLFNGANAAEIINILANGGRAVFFRNVANVVMDMNDVETISFNALGGADNIVVNDLSGTDVKNIRIELNAAGGVPDGQADIVDINTRGGNDNINVVVSGGKASLTGLAETYEVLGVETSDRLIVRGAGGNDTINTSAVAAGALLLTLDGGNGDDTYVTDALGAITENAGNGTDTVRTALNLATLGLNLENLTFTGGGSFDGQGNELNNVITVLNGTGKLFGEGGNDRLDALGAGQRLDGGAGTDTVSYAFSGTSVVADLRQPSLNAGDAFADTYSGIENMIGTSLGDTLRGTDGVNTINAGNGNDIVQGRAGNDTLIGAGGNDLLYGEIGDDVLAGGSGKDNMYGGVGSDRFDFNGIAESTADVQRDVIVDFAVDPAAGAAFVDRIDVETIDAMAGLAGNQAFTFIGSGAFTAEGQIRVVQANLNTLIQFNTSGVDGAEMEILLINFTASNLSVADFIL